MGHQTGYGIVMKKTILNEELPTTAKAIYAFLCVHADIEGYSFPGVRLTCDKLGIREDTFYKHMRKLKEAGVVEVSRKHNGSKFSYNIYKLTDRPYPKKQGMASIPPPEKPGMELSKPHPKKADTVFLSPKKPDTNNTTPKNTTIRNTTNENILICVLQILNDAKAQRFAKGRLKDSAYGRRVIDHLKSCGYSDDEIIQAAHNTSQMSHKNIDWNDLEVCCKQIRR